VLSETGEGKVFEEWVGEASVFGFEILLWSLERLCVQKPGWSIVLLRGWVYVIGRPRSQNGNPD
jgi:hypothetical protein